MTTLRTTTARPPARQAGARLHAQPVGLAAGRAQSLRAQVDREQALCVRARERAAELSDADRATAAPADAASVALLHAALADAEVHATAHQLLTVRLRVMEYAATTSTPADADLAPLRVVDAARDAAAEAQHEMFGVAAALQSTATGTAADAAQGVPVVSSMEQHGLVEPVTAAVARTSAALDVLRADLDDLANAAAAVGQPLPLPTDLTVFDIWFEDLFTDWLVPQRLAAANAVVRSCQEDLQDVSGRLDSLVSSLSRGPGRPAGVRTAS